MAKRPLGTTVAVKVSPKLKRRMDKAASHLDLALSEFMRAAFRSMCDEVEEETMRSKQARKGEKE